MVPDISKEIHSEDISNILENRYSVMGPLWVKHQMEWSNGVYATFKDHDKFLIVIYLVKKTLDFYSRNFTKLTFEEFYSRDIVEIEKFNISEVAIALNIPKESTRRKLAELEDIGAIKKLNNRIIIDRNSFNFSKPIDSVIRVSRFLSTLSELCFDEKILPMRLTSESLEEIIKKNFSYVWKIYYELQIPMMLGYKNIFGNIEAFHIFGTCVVNQHLSTKKLNEEDKVSRDVFIKSLLFSTDEIDGLNAMSISDITGIPRATVIRKLKILLDKNFLTIDKKKHYKISGNFFKVLMPKQKTVFDRLAKFSSTIYNLTIL
tara:strand:+ start:619 stop:1572 length:954 start_codon:yes stop_codon:yes gene_type:complete